MFQSKYRESGKKENSTSLYNTLPETKDTRHARDAAEILSEVRLHVLDSVNVTCVPIRFLITFSEYSFYKCY